PKVAQPEQPMPHRHRVSKVDPNRQNVAGRQDDDQARSQMPGKVGQNRFRHRIANEDLSVSDSARLRLLAQVNKTSAPEVRRLDFANQSRSQVVEDLLVKRAPKQNPSRPPTANRRRNVVAHLREPSAERASLKEGRRS